MTNDYDLCPDFLKRAGSAGISRQQTAKRRSGMPIRIETAIAELPMVAYGAPVDNRAVRLMDHREREWTITRSDRRVRMMFLLLFLQLTRSAVLVGRIVFLQLLRAGRIVAKKATELLSR